MEAASASLEEIPRRAAVKVRLDEKMVSAQAVENVLRCTYGAEPVGCDDLKSLEKLKQVFPRFMLGTIRLFLTCL